MKRLWYMMVEKKKTATDCFFDGGKRRRRQDIYLFRQEKAVPPIERANPPDAVADGNEKKRGEKLYREFIEK